MAGPPPLLGKTLANGKYRVKKLLGRGGMGAVYEGEHVEIGKRVAIKVIDPEHSKNDEVVERFRQEARAASRVESEHIVQVFDVGTDDVAGLYMVMEFLVGEDLSHRLDREDRIHVEVAVDIAYQAARGLHKAHAAGVVHRDLKPANVFLSARDDGLVTVKIVDFGISKMLVQNISEKDAKRPITRFGSAVGTPQYMSPEQAQGQQIDHRTDVWALGCVLYEMLAGEQAYKLLESYEQTIFHIVLKKPKDLREVAPWVPIPVVEVVEQALEHDLDLRIKDCATFASMLQEALNGKSSGKEAPSRILQAVDASSARGVSSRRAAARPDAIVVPPSSERGEAMSDATVPAMDIPLDLPLSRPQPPPTVAGVTAVKRVEPTTSDPPFSAHDSLADLVSPPPRKKTGWAKAILVLVLIGGAASVGFAIVNRQNASNAQTPAASSTNAPAAEIPQPKTTALVSAKPSVAASAKPSSSTSTSASSAPSASASSQSSTSIKPWQKPLGYTPPATTTTEATTEPTQFGGTGVSSTY